MGEPLDYSLGISQFFGGGDTPSVYHPLASSGAFEEFLFDPLTGPNPAASADAFFPPTPACPDTPVTPLRPGAADEEMIAVPPLQGGDLPEPCRAVFEMPATPHHARPLQAGRAVFSVSPLSPLNDIEPLMEVPPMTLLPGSIKEKSGPASAAGNNNIVAINVAAMTGVEAAPGRPPHMPMPRASSRRPVASAGGGSSTRRSPSVVARASTSGVGKVDFKNSNGRLRTPRTPRKRRGRQRYVTQIQPVAPYPAGSQPQLGASTGPSYQNPAKFAFSPELYTRIFGTGTNQTKHKRGMKKLVTTQSEHVVDSLMSSILTEIDGHGTKMKLDARERLRQKETDASGLSKNEKKKMASRREAEVTRIHRRSSHDALREALKICLMQFLHSQYVEK